MTKSGKIAGALLGALTAVMLLASPASAERATVGGSLVKVHYQDRHQTRNFKRHRHNHGHYRNHDRRHYGQHRRWDRHHDRRYRSRFQSHRDYRHLRRTYDRRY